MNIKVFVRNFFLELSSIFECIKISYLSKKRPDEYVVVQAWVKKVKSKIVPNNWGDDINVFFIEEYFHKKVLILPQTKIAHYFPLKTYVLIGSTIEYANKKKSIVFGSGLMNDKVSYPIPDMHTKIYSVRGELTYKWLISNGIKCPRVFGDPALLLPLYYKPDNKKKYKISYIPHHSEFQCNCAFLDKIKSMGIHIIDMTKYINWKDIPDQICASEFVISSSLHGIIVAETYQIPNVWSITMEQIEGFEFKYYDFYSSINKKEIRPIYLNENLTYHDLEKLKSNWSSAFINYDLIISALPF